MQDENNTAVSGISYYIKQNGNFINTTLVTDKQGIATAFLPNGYYQLYDLATQKETPFSINNQNTTLDLQLANEVTLRVTKDGQVLSSGIIVIYGDNSLAQSIQVTNGIGKGRLKSGNDYHVTLSAGGITSIQQKVTISNGELNLDFVSLQIKSDGKGLPFPYLSNDNSLTYYLKGNTVRLTAVPMKGWTCEKWTINGMDIEEDMIDYTLEESTIATAVFNKKDLPTKINQYKNSDNDLAIFPNPTEAQINFSEHIRGNAVIYGTDGKIVKQIYVYGNGINVSDLIPGWYVLVIETENQSYKGNFMKK